MLAGQAWAQDFDHFNEMLSQFIGYINPNSNQIMVHDSVTEYALSGEPLFKIVYEWDDSLKHIVATAYYYDENNRVPYVKTEYSCNANGHIAIKTKYDWDSNTNSWVGTYKPYYTWDNETNSWIMETTDYDEVTYYESGTIKTARKGNDWPNERMWYFYENGDLAAYSDYEHIEFYDIEGNRYYNGATGSNSVNKIECDAQGRIMVKYEVSFSYSEVEVYCSSKTEYTYDANGNKTLEIKYDWDEENNSWVNSNGCVYYTEGEWRKSARFYWNTEKGEWDLSSETRLEKTEYDANGNKTLELYTAYNANTNSWTNGSKTEYTYNSGKLTLTATYNWNSETNSWVNSSKTENTYDSNGNQTLEVNYNWKPETNSWVNSYKYEYTHNDQMSVRVYYDWNTEANDWVKRSKTEYGNVINGMFTVLASYNWNANTNSWVGSGDKTENVFDANGNRIRWTSYYWNSNTNSWVNRIKSEYAYDSNGIITQEAYYQWNNETNSWVGRRNYGRNEYTTDANGNRIRYHYIWDTETNSWVNDSKREYTSDANGNQIQIDYSWNAETNSWVNNRKTEYTSDANGNRTLEINYNWDAEANSWVKNTKNEYTYDAKGRQTLEAHYQWNAENNSWKGEISGKREYAYDANGKKTLEAVYYWSTKTNSWLGSYKYEYAYDIEGEQKYYVSYNWNKDKNDWNDYLVDSRSNNLPFILKATRVKNQQTNRYEYVCQYSNSTEIFSLTGKPGNIISEGDKTIVEIQDDSNNTIRYYFKTITVESEENQGGNQQGGSENQGGENNQEGNENQGGENQNGNEENQGGNEQGGESGNQENGNENENQGGNENNPATAVTESAANAINIYAHGRTIVVENATDEIRVYDAMGALVCRDAINRVRMEIPINTTGVYIVKTGKTVKRVVVN